MICVARSAQVLASSDAPWQCSCWSREAGPQGSHGAQNVPSAATLRTVRRPVTQATKTPRDNARGVVYAAISATSHRTCCTLGERAASFPCTMPFVPSSSCGPSAALVPLKHNMRLHDHATSRFLSVERYRVRAGEGSDTQDECLRIPGLRPRRHNQRLAHNRYTVQRRCTHP
jgi:hypothetical protein